MELLGKRCMLFVCLLYFFCNYTGKVSVNAGRRGGMVQRARRGEVMGRMRRKGELPAKTCATCGRPFVWRRKWARDWENVRHCSERCRRARKPAAATKPGAGR
jgi:hypothetical protein